jgi:hypothetical protein
VQVMAFRLADTRLSRCKFRSKMDWNTGSRCKSRFDPVTVFWAIPPYWSFDYGEGYEAIGRKRQQGIA